MNHDFDECRRKIITDVADGYISTAAFLKSIVSGGIILFTVLAVPTFLWAKHNETIQQLNVLRIGQLEQSMKDIKDSREDLKVMLVNQRQMINEESRVLAQLRARLQ